MQSPLGLENEIIPWIGKTSKQVDNYHSALLKSGGFNVTKEQWILLKILSVKTGLSQNEIACFANRDKTTVTRVITHLEKKGYISRISSEMDKRINLIFISKLGEQIIHETEPIRLRVVSVLQSGITVTEIETVIRVMKKIQKNISDIQRC